MFVGFCRILDTQLQECKLTVPSRVDLKGTYSFDAFMVCYLWILKNVNEGKVINCIWNMNKLAPKTGVGKQVNWKLYKKYLI